MMNITIETKLGKARLLKVDEENNKITVLLGDDITATFLMDNFFNGLYMDSRTREQILAEYYFSKQTSKPYL